MLTAGPKNAPIFWAWFVCCIKGCQQRRGPFSGFGFGFRVFGKNSVGVVSSTKFSRGSKLRPGGGGQKGAVGDFPS